ncbi:TPA: hypothetical protein ACID7F_000455 [Pseudomonas aeruginosa]|nr:hypothetical protein [Pseudomonas aeruginosa]EKU4051292.1 hypothetical protein [Pseudomonas aeruginosa]EKX9336014.1 hypothetical protein [Pseudomonas aeruginosa]
MFKFAHWRYMIFALLAAFITALKGFFYAHLLDEVQYANVSYYLLMLGVGVLFIGSGVIIRCHTEIPILAKEESSECLNDFIRQVKVTGFVYWLLLCTLIPLASYMTGMSLSFQVLLVVQVLVFFLFTIDLMVVKGRLDFVGYARQLFLRNAVIAAAGFLFAHLSADSFVTVAAEVLCAVIFYSRGVLLFFLDFRVPSLTFFSKSITYMPVTLVGALFQFVDRLLASSVLRTEEFSRFSYFSLVIMAGLSVQQLMNTRVITVLPEMCEKGARVGYRYVVKISLVMALLMLFALTTGMFVLQSPWLVADWFEVNYMLGMVFVLVALVRSVDFYSSYLLVMGRRFLLLKIQLSMLFLFCVGALIFKVFLSNTGLWGFALMVLSGFLVFLVCLILSAWFVSRNKDFCI